MGDQHIVLFAVAIFSASVDAQDFTVRPESGYRRGNEDVELVWEFDVGSEIFLGGEWWNTEGAPVMSKSGSDNTTVASGFEHKFKPIGEYGMKILNFTEMDNGIYTCRMIYFQSSSKNLDDSVNISASTIEGDALNTPNLIVAFGNEEFVVRDNFNKLDFNVLTKLTTYAPVNNPPLVDAVISVSEQETENCFRLSDENCTVKFVPNKEGNITITVTLSHPLVDSANVTWIMTVEDPNILTSSMAPDDTSVRTDTPPTEDPSVTQPSSSPTVTATDDPPPAPQSGWSHWYILLIALGCLVILVVIAVVIHRRSQRKDDDLDRITELKSPSVHAAPTDHLRANTADYRPSQQQQPRREDNYVQGTSGARL